MGGRLGGGGEAPSPDSPPGALPHLPPPPLAVWTGCPRSPPLPASPAVGWFRPHVQIQQEKLPGAAQNTQGKPGASPAHLAPSTCLDIFSAGVAGKEKK